MGCLLSTGFNHLCSLNLVLSKQFKRVALQEALVEHVNQDAADESNGGSDFCRSSRFNA